MATLGERVAAGQWGPAQKKTKSFRTVVENASDVTSNGLKGSMSADAVAPASPQDAAQNVEPEIDLNASAADPEAGTLDPDAEAHGAIDDTYKRLNEMLGATPGINYEDKYNEILKQAQGQQVPQAPGRMQSFFSALGSPASAPGMLSDARAQEHKANDDKFNRIMSLKEAILHGEIQKLMTEGNFKKALAQSEQLEKLHATQDRLKREGTINDFKKQQDVLQGNRVELENLRQDAALQRARLMIQGRKDLQALSTKQQDMYAHEYATNYRTLMSQKNITGDPVYTDQQAQELARRAADDAFDLSNRAEGSPGRVEGTGSTGSTSPEARTATTRGDLIRRAREANKQ